MGRLLALALALVLALGGLWLVSRREQRTSEAFSELAVARASNAQDELAAPLVVEASPVQHGPVSRESAPASAPRAADGAPRSSVATRGEPDAVAMPRSQLAGRVLDHDGTPSVAAQVEAESTWDVDHPLAPLGSAQTASDGTFHLDCLGVGPFRVRATAAADGAIAASASVDDVAGGRTDLELVLPERCTLRANAVDDLGRAVPIYSVRFRTAAGREEGTHWTHEYWVTDERGAFELAMPCGEWELAVSGKQDRGEWQGTVTLPTPAPFTITLVREAIVRGIVVDASGAPVRNASIVSPGWQTGSSKKDGRFELRGPAGKDVVVWAWIQGRAPSERAHLDLASGQEFELTLRLNERARVTGEVVGVGGRPLGGVEVHVGQLALAGVWSSSMDSSGPARTDAAGRFELEVAPGRLVISLAEDTLGTLQEQTGAPAPHACLQRNVEVGPGESAHVRFVLGGSPVRLHGRIEVDGRAPEWAMARVYGVGESAQRATYSEGEYELFVPGPGSYVLLVSTGELNVQPVVDVPETEDFRSDVSLVLGRISGHVSDETGAALSGVVVDAMSHGENQRFQASGRARTDEHGAFVLSVAAGTYSVFPRYDFEEERSFLEPERKIVRVDAGTPANDLDFELRTANVIAGSMRLASGSPVKNGGVSVSRVAGEEHQTVATDADGRFRVQSLPAGSYYVSAGFAEDEHAGPFWMTREPLRIDVPGSSRSLALELVPATLVQAELLDASGETQWAEFEIVDRQGRATRMKRVDGAWCTLAVIPPGSFLLRAKHEKGMVERAFSLAAGETNHEIELTLE